MGRPVPKKIDSDLQAQVDAQLLDQGAFSPLELLMDSGRLDYRDYERWRRREVERLDEVLMGNLVNIRTQLEDVTAYARGIGLVEQPREFLSWPAGQDGSVGKALAISTDPALGNLIARTYVPAQDVPQRDLFLDNPAVALSNGIVRAVAARNSGEAQRQLDRLYAQAPNHPDLAAFDQLLEALGRVERPISEGPRQLAFLRDTAPTARRLMGVQSRELMTPLWRKLAEALAEEPFLADQPELHASYAWGQAQDWTAASKSVLAEPDWQRHAALCLYQAQSALHRQCRAEAVTAWSHLFWTHPRRAIEMLEHRPAPDASLAALWRRFADEGGDLDVEPAPEDFPAWLLLHEPGLALQLTEDLASRGTAGEQHYRMVHRWVQARRDGRHAEEIELRRSLQAQAPLLFRELKRRV